MSSEEVAPAVDQAQGEDASAPKSSSRTRPSSTVAGANPKKKVARPSVPGAKKSAGGASKKVAKPVADKEFQYGDIIVARLKGYPAWPARIADPETVPSVVKAARPGAAGRPAVSGKKITTHCVEFFPEGNFSWLNIRDIDHLSPEEITEFLNTSHRKTGELRQGYEVAQNPKEWDAEQVEHRRGLEAAANEVDELEDEDELADTSAGKRKKAPKEKSKKKAKTSKAEVEEEDDAPAPKATKAKADKSKAKPAAKAEAAPPADDDPLSSDPECVKVKDWRHKLQRAFLGKAPPTADEMPTYDTLFKTIEDYKNITIDALTYSKIGKVMKKIGTLTNVARDEEFKITERASKLMSDWQEIVGGSKAEGTTANGNGDAPKSEAAPAEAGAEPEQTAADPAVNGTGEGEGEGEKTEAEPKADAEPTPA